MSKQALATLSIIALLVGATHAQRGARYDVVEESTIDRTLSFAAGGGRTLDVRNINGSIHVEASNDATVQLTIRKIIRGETRDDVAEAQRDVRLEFADAAQRIGATVIDQRGHVCGEDWNDRGEHWERVHYEVKFDFTIRVPRQAAVRLCSINGGDIIVNGTQGDFDVTNVNGLIEMHGVAGAGRAHTVNGPVTVTFTANPRQPSSFKSVNGNVDVQFVDGLSADFAMKTMNGGLFTDFDAQPLAAQATPQGERRNGKLVFHVNQFTRVRVGSGGPEITFETLNGNVRARRAQGRAQ